MWNYTHLKNKPFIITLFVACCSWNWKIYILNISDIRYIINTTMSFWIFLVHYTVIIYRKYYVKREYVSQEPIYVHVSATTKINI